MAEATTQAQDLAAATPKLTQAQQRVEAARRRVEYLNNLKVRASIRAQIAGVSFAELPAYIKGLKDLGLLDPGERLTTAGQVYVYVGNKPPKPEIPARERTDHTPEREATPAYLGPAKRAIWSHIGGDESRLDTVLAKLIAEGLIACQDGHYVIVG